MTDGKPNESVPEGEAVDNVDTISKKSPAQQKKEENDLMEKELEREEALKARAQLGGRAMAGQQPPKEEEVSDKDYAMKAMGGEFNEKK